MEQAYTVRQSMSASAEKATRRELRRAVGVQAIGVIDSQTQTIHAQTEAIKANAQYFEDRLNDQRGQIDLFRAHIRRTFWQRVRWLVTGR